MISDPISLIGTKFLDKHAAVYDFKFQEALKNAPWVEWLSKPGYFECKEEFLECIHGWIHSTKLNSVNGLDRFSQRHMIIGTTQVFDECYHRYSDKRLRIFRGEYAYHLSLIQI